LVIAVQNAGLSLELNMESVAAAVSIYIDYKVLYLLYLKRYNNKIEIIIRDYLSSNANGIFLWVALAC